MENGQIDIRYSRELFERQVMAEIKLLTTKLDDLQNEVASISQTLDRHLATVHLQPRRRLGDRDHDNDLRQQNRTGMRRRRHTSEDHKQACLRKSLQMNIILLVENLPFTESELGDMLISEECLTEDECNDLRRCLPRKDQARNLVRLVKGRSFKVMSNFLSCVGRISPDIAQKVWKTYGENLKTLGTPDACVFCSLRNSVDIKLLADHLWSIGLLSDPLYDDIASCSQPDESHWRNMASECNKSENARKAIYVICDALDRKGHYYELVTGLRRKTKLECCCYRQEVPCDNIAHARTDVRVEDGESSISPNSSDFGDFERSPLSDISSHEDLVSLPYTDVLDIAARSSDASIDLFCRRRSNSFGKSSAAKRPLKKRRASMFC